MYVLCNAKRAKRGKRRACTSSLVRRRSCISSTAARLSVEGPLLNRFDDRGGGPASAHCNAVTCPESSKISRGGTTAGDVREKMEIEEGTVDESQGGPLHLFADLLWLARPLRILREFLAFLPPRDRPLTEPLIFRLLLPCSTFWVNSSRYSLATCRLEF